MEEHIKFPLPAAGSHIFFPTANAPLDILANTAAKLANSKSVATSPS